MAPHPAGYSVVIQSGDREGEGRGDGGDKALWSGACRRRRGECSIRSMNCLHLAVLRRCPSVIEAGLEGGVASGLPKMEIEGGFLNVLVSKIEKLSLMGIPTINPAT